jgi:hypothetical protein
MGSGWFLVSGSTGLWSDVEDVVASAHGSFNCIGLNSSLLVIVSVMPFENKSISILFDSFSVFAVRLSFFSTSSPSKFGFDSLCG